MARTRFGILGCGSAAVPVSDALARSELTELALVADINEPLARDLGERHGVPCTTDLNVLFEHPEIDVVYIAVPHYLLAPFARRALEANKHVLVEKPMALNTAEADELIGLAERKGKTLGVFFEMRFAPGYAQARSLIQAGAIGEITGIRIQSLIDKKLSYWQVGYSGRTFNPWRGEKAKAGGGVTLMNTSHLIDAVYFMTGLEVTRVACEYGSLVAPVQVEDTLSATLRYDNNAIGSLFSGAHIAGASAEERIEIFGTKGTLRVPDPYHQSPLQVYLMEATAEIPANEWHSVPHEPVNVFDAAIRGYATAVQNGQQAPVDGVDARRVLNIVTAMYRAAEEKRVIDLEQGVDS
jgi:predicted dehydrogenase